MSLKTTNNSSSVSGMAPSTLRSLASTFKNIGGAYINSTWVAADKNFAVINPATSQVAANVTDCDADLTARAIDSALGCFRTWGCSSTAKEREDLLVRLNNTMLKHKGDLAKILTSEMGKPLAEAQAEITYASSFLQWFAAEARRTYGEVIPPSAPGRMAFASREPVGVAGIITPIFDEAAAPPGLFNVVPCSRQNAGDVGKTLCRSEAVRALSFTGSTPVGKLLLAQCADTVKKVGLELGGNAMFIVFESADVDKAVAGAVAGRFRCSGQTCICPNRFFIHRSIKESFVSKLKSAVDALTVGNGMDEGVQIGPLINEAAVKKVVRLVKDAVGKGAKVVTGCEPLPALGPNFYKPGIVTGVTKEMSIYHEEIFGPVAAIVE